MLLFSHRCECSEACDGAGVRRFVEARRRGGDVGRPGPPAAQRDVEEEGLARAGGACGSAEKEAGALKPLSCQRRRRRRRGRRSLRSGMGGAGGGQARAGDEDVLALADELRGFELGRCGRGGGRSGGVRCVERARSVSSTAGESRLDFLRRGGSVRTREVGEARRRRRAGSRRRGGVLPAAAGRGPLLARAGPPWGGVAAVRGGAGAGLRRRLVRRGELPLHAVKRGEHRALRPWVGRSRVV